MNHVKLCLALVAQFWVATLFSQISFTDQTSLLNPADHHSGVTVAVIDMNGDGLDDIVRLDLGKNLNIQYQTTPNAPFSALQVGALPSTTSSQWGMCTADIDNNGFADILAGGRYDAIKIAKASADGSSFSITSLTAPGTFVQGVNFADINNDGWLDAFVCHDDGVARVFGNNGDGTFTYQPLWINLATVPSSDNSGNYGSIWSDVDNDGDLDLYIAHCRQGVNVLTDPRRINQLFLNNGNGTYTQDITNTSGLRINYQSWTADFGDIDNDGDFDCFVTNHDHNCQLLINDGAGHFTDISASAGLLGVSFGTPIQGVFRDFDNDGFVDIAVAGSKQVILKNNGNQTFTQIGNPFNNSNMESFAIGDLNGDGFQDIYASYAQIYTTPSSIPDVLWMNNGNSNHYFGLSLRGIQSNRDAIGAKVQLFSSLGIQTREARSGESYGISNSPQIHFGLGQVETIDSVVVRWPSGIRHTIYQPRRDQYITFSENGCQISPINLEVLGNPIICTGQSVDIQAPIGYTYEWNTGDTTQVITVSDAGDYRVSVTNDQGCMVVSNSVVITVDPADAPTISMSGDTIFCSGSSLVLTSSDAATYLWSNGSTTKSITVTESGTFSVTAQGLCATFSTAPITVLVLKSSMPGELTYIPAPDSNTLYYVTGNTLHWFDDPNSNTPLATGNPLLNPPPIPSLTYWVSNTTSYDRDNQYVGMPNHQGSVLSDNSYNGGLIFDCFKAFKLAKTKVTTTVAGNRQINLFNSSQELLQSKTVNIPVGTSIIDLDFDIPVGTDMLLTTDVATNQASLGTASPQLHRSTLGCAFPYTLPKVVSIKNSTVDVTRYYYFYDWEIDFYGYECESARMQVNAEVYAAAHAPEWASSVVVYPNPTSGELNVGISGYAGGKMDVTLRNMQGVTVFSAPKAVAPEFAQITMDVSRLAAGVYWVALAGEGGVVRRKVVVE